MSMENAILAHAAALDKLAEAIAKVFGERVALAAGLQAIDMAQNSSAKVEETKADTPKSTKGKTETKAEPTADAGNSTAQANSADDGGADDAAEAMDYATAKPRLLAVVKKVGKEKVQALIKTFGADKADQVDPAQLADLVAKAEKLEKD